MATSITKAPLFRSVAVRSYSTGLAPVSGTSNYEVKCSALPNKLVVAAADNDSPIARVSIVFRAGARNEAPDNYGATHVLRIAAGLSTRNSSQFAIIRNIQQVGANVSCTADRETVAYTLEGTRNAIEETLPFLTDIATQQVFKPWEVSDNTPRLRYELATRPPQLRAIDLLHKAAFRTGLGNSLFISKHQLGKISSETLQHYVSSNFTSGRTAVVGLGVDHSELSLYAQKLKLENGEGTTSSSSYKGGEIRSDKGGDFAYVAIGVEGAPISNQKEALSFGVLQHALGVGPALKWSQADNGLLGKAAGTFNDPYSLSAFNVSYSDTGLFGALVVGTSGIAGKLVESAFSVLKSGSLSDADVNRGKNQLKAALLLNYESGAKAILDIGYQAALTGTVMSANQLADAVDSLRTRDVQAAASKVASGKVTIAAVGNLRSVPFLDELK